MEWCCNDNKMLMNSLFHCYDELQYSASLTFLHHSIIIPSFHSIIIPFHHHSIPYFRGSRMTVLLVTIHNLAKWCMGSEEKLSNFPFYLSFASTENFLLDYLKQLV